MITGKRGLSAALALGLWGGAASAGSWDESYFPNVPLLTHEGEEVRFYDDLIDERIVVVTFAYTDCPDLCGLSTARLAQVVDWLGDRVGRDVFIYTISLDPETDTPEKLKAYAEAFGAPEGWTFLTGTRENIDTVRFKMGERSASLADHRSDMVIGNDVTGQWRRTSLMGSLVVTTNDILDLDPSWAPPLAASASHGEKLTLKDTRGESLFITACAACHAIGTGAGIGPDLSGLSLQRDRAWLEAFLRDPGLMLEKGDPTALALDAAYPAIRMPYLGLGPNDIADILHYIDAQTEMLGAAMVQEAQDAPEAQAQEEVDDHAAAASGAGQGHEAPVGADSLVQ